MEVHDTEVIGNCQERTESAKPPLVQKESAESTGASAQAGLPSEGDELEELYENRQAAVSAPALVEQKDRDFLATQDAIKTSAAQPFYEMDIAPADEEQEQPFYKMEVTDVKDTEKQGQPFYEMKVASADVVQPEEPPPPPADVSCRSPDPLYVRRVGLRFWCTKRILDWQRQALRAREDPGAVLKPVREYGEESVLQNEHGHYENEEEHKYYQYDKNHAHYENDEEHALYENDREHALYENDEEKSNLSTHVYADLDPDFLAAQDEIQNAAAQPFYEMDITPADEEQEQPFYKMDVTNAKEKQRKEQPFYEMNVSSADENNEQVFYRMDSDQLGKPTPSENAYEDLDPDFLAAQDAVDRRHGGKKQSKGDDSGTRCSQNSRLFCRSRPGRMVALCVGVIISAGIAATVVALILNQHSVPSVHPDENNVVNQTSLSVTSSTSSALLPVTSQATSETTDATDWWGELEWTLYVRAYFLQNKDDAAGLEERYPDNEVVMTLLEDRFFWPFVCWYWKIYNDLPHTLYTAVGYGIEYGITSDYMESHGLSAYSEVFSSMLKALEALRNKTEGLPNNGNTRLALSLSGHVLLDTDVEALVNLFPYLEGLTEFYLVDCKISPDAATILAGQLHLLHTLTDLNMKSNKIGDEGVEAIAETFPHLKKLQLLNIANTSITNVGGRAVARSLVHLQQLQELFLQKNELDIRNSKSFPTPYTAPLQLSTTLGSPQGATSLRLSYATPSPLYPMLNTGSHVVTAAGALSEGPAVGERAPGSQKLEKVGPSGLTGLPKGFQECGHRCGAKPSLRGKNSLGSSLGSKSSLAAAYYSRQKSSSVDASGHGPAPSWAGQTPRAQLPRSANFGRLAKGSRLPKENGQRPDVVQFDVFYLMVNGEVIAGRPAPPRTVLLDMAALSTTRLPSNVSIIVTWRKQRQLVTSDQRKTGRCWAENGKISRDKASIVAKKQRELDTRSKKATEDTQDATAEEEIIHLSSSHARSKQTELKGKLHNSPFNQLSATADSVMRTDSV
ncbi:hypothetical protein Bbelb_313320 [Branchiostoma belcheri]|nr:hypothetical protein Bbelb_313320 [Branchiostoma belcheri]